MDIALNWDVANAVADIALNGMDLQTDEGLTTAVLISAFTDRAALPDDALPPGITDRRGYWGDDDPQHPWGSRLWLLDRAKQTEETRQRAIDYLKECLQWLIDDGIAGGVDVGATWLATSRLAAAIVITKANGEQVSVQFNYVWEHS